MAKEYIMSRELKAQEEENKNIDHPSHYNREGAMECIEEMELIFGKEAVQHFCLLNAWKYRYRAADKNGEEDLRKSDWYLSKYKELSDSKEKESTFKINTSPAIINTWEEPKTVPYQYPWNQPWYDVKNPWWDKVTCGSVITPATNVTTTSAPLSKNE